MVGLRKSWKAIMAFVKDTRLNGVGRGNEIIAL